MADDKMAADLAYLKGLEDGVNAERTRIHELVATFTCPCGEEDCAGWDTLSAFLDLIGEDSGG